MFDSFDSGSFGSGTWDLGTWDLGNYDSSYDPGSGVDFNLGDLGTGTYGYGDSSSDYGYNDTGALFGDGTGSFNFTDPEFHTIDPYAGTTQYTTEGNFFDNINWGKVGQVGIGLLNGAGTIANARSNYRDGSTLQGLLGTSQQQAGQSYGDLRNYMAGRGLDYLTKTDQTNAQSIEQLNNYLSGQGTRNLNNMTDNGQTAWSNLQESYTNPSKYLNGADFQAMNRVLNNTLSRQDAANGSWGNDINRAMKLQDNMAANLEKYRQGLAGIYNTAAGNANAANSQYGNLVANKFGTSQTANTRANDTFVNTLQNMYNTASRDTATNANNFMAGNALQNQAYLQGGKVLGGIAGALAGNSGTTNRLPTRGNPGNSPYQPENDGLTNAAIAGGNLLANDYGVGYGYNAIMSDNINSSTMAGSVADYYVPGSGGLVTNLFNGNGFNSNNPNSPYTPKNNNATNAAILAGQYVADSYGVGYGYNAVMSDNINKGTIVGSVSDYYAPGTGEAAAEIVNGHTDGENIGTVVGGAIGAIYFGPVGGAIGSEIGGWVGDAVSDLFDW